MLQQAVSAYESIGLGLFRSLVTIDLGEAFLLAGEVDNAYSFADQGLALARQRAESGHEAYGLRLLGEIASHPDAGEPETAMGHFTAALDMAESLGMRPLVAKCHLGIGRLREREGRQDEAREHIETALALSRTMGMRLGEPQSMVQRVL